MSSDNHSGARRLSFAGALIDVVVGCQNDLKVIKERQASIKARLSAAAIHGIDPAAVRRLLMTAKKNEIDLDRNNEIDAIYKAIVAGSAPVLPSRSDSELDRVLALTNTDKPPKIAAIKQAIGCSQGKAQKLRTLAAARLQAKSSSSGEIDEHELLTKQEEANGGPPVGELPESLTEVPECEAGNKGAPSHNELATGDVTEPPEAAKDDSLEFPDFLKRGAPACNVSEVVGANTTDTSAYPDRR
jgi:hypothetical protein